MPRRCMCTRAYWSWRRELPGALSIFLNALEAPRLLFDPAFAPAMGAFLKVAAEACIDGNETAVVEAALLNKGETRALTAISETATERPPGAGADVNVKAGGKWTPLHHAAFHNRLEIAKVLLAHGAAVNARDVHGQPPVALAQRDDGGAAAAARRPVRDNKVRIGKMEMETRGCGAPAWGCGTRWPHPQAGAPHPPPWRGRARTMRVGSRCQAPGACRVRRRLAQTHRTTATSAEARREGEQDGAPGLRHPEHMHRGTAA